MKKRLFFAGISVLISYGFVGKNEIRKSIFTIQELIENPKVSVKLISNGTHSGKSVSLQIKSDLNKSFSIKIPQGTLFYPLDNGEQTLVLPKTELIAYSKEGPSKFLIDGFCTESSDRSPRSGAEFALGETEDKDLLSLLSLIKNKNYKEDQIQESIWCITDKKPLSNIYEEEGNELKEIVSDITGLPVPWQSTRREISVDENNHIVAEPILIKGKIVFNTSKIVQLKSKIIKEDGELVLQFSKSMKVPVAEGITLNFKVKVKGWENGNYFVVYYTQEGREIVKQKFTI